MSIPIVNDTIEEGEESFDVVLEASGIGVAVGYPQQAEITIAGKNKVKMCWCGQSSKSEGCKSYINTTLNYPIGLVTQRLHSSMYALYIDEEIMHFSSCLEKNY